MLTDSPDFLPYGRQHIDDEDIAAVVSVLKSPTLTGGRMVGEFERAFAQVVGANDAVSCGTGTAALHLATLALGIGEGQEVIVPSLTFLATANVVCYAAGTVIFADVDPDTGLMTPDNLSEALTRSSSPVAVFPVHMNGHIADMPGISQVARAKGLAIVEDACHAVGGQYKGASGQYHPVGACAHSDMTCFSFHPVKTIAAGEGGAVTLSDPFLAERCRLARSHGMVRDPAAFIHQEAGFDENGEPNPWYYEMSELGFNHRLDEMSCALALSQLSKLSRFVEARRTLADFYDKHLARFGNLLKPVSRPAWSDGGWHLYVVHIDYQAAGISRANLMRGLQERGIGTNVHYRPVHQQPYYRALYPDVNLPGADQYYMSCLTLPLFVDMTEEDVIRVADTLMAVIGG
jgi:UDP-4-amino-4,6-dideoxy-N-acetyl-beta-L-altrosamine transaminase